MRWDDGTSKTRGHFNRRGQRIQTERLHERTPKYAMIRTGIDKAVTGKSVGTID
jgi:hypothetical protein